MNFVVMWKNYFFCDFHDGNDYDEIWAFAEFKCIGYIFKNTKYVGNIMLVHVLSHLSCGSALNSVSVNSLN